MTMHNPPHPGAFIKATYLDPFGLSVRFLAKYLKVAPSTINRLINEEASVSPEMACRLSAALGRSPESWLALQAQYDLWVTKHPKLKKIDFSQFEDAA
ncbi:HigA family addiction module antitoxin [Candidiatus Paracoxiella cheracis]|uniref:HigA family addiction module antitoxin n=1 Tax=Candidiatus Paracoxiella cheracis TaxID=3405120 RepID=UPI003BF5893D